MYIYSRYAATIAPCEICTVNTCAIMAQVLCKINVNEQVRVPFGVSAVCGMMLDPIINLMSDQGSKIHELEEIGQTMPCKFSPPGKWKQVSHEMMLQH